MEVSIPHSAPNAFRLPEDGLPPLQAHQFLSFLLLSGKLARRRRLLAASLALSRVPRSSFAWTTLLPFLFQIPWTQQVIPSLQGRCFQVLSEDMRIRPRCPCRWHEMRCPRGATRPRACSWFVKVASCLLDADWSNTHDCTRLPQHAAASCNSHFDGNSIL